MGLRIAHFSDTHLGYRNWSHSRSDGTNCREFDVFQSFKAVLDQIIEADPHLVIHAGDFFDKARPSNRTVVSAYHALRWFQSVRGGRPFVLIAGNHDSPRLAESGNILELFATIPGMHVFWKGSTESLLLDSGCEHWKDLPATHICAIPHAALVRQSLAENPPMPLTSAAINILVLHGLANAVRASVKVTSEFDENLLGASRWDYVALGDYHSYQRLDKNMYYPGSTDFTSSNFWDEKAEKGWILADLTELTYEFRVNQRVRKAYEIKASDASKWDVDAATQHIMAAVEPYKDQSEAMIRHLVFGLSPTVRREIHGLIKNLEDHFFHYELAVKPSQFGGTNSFAQPGEKMTNKQAWEEHIKEASLPLGLQREAVASHGVALIDEAEEQMNEPEVAGNAVAFT